MQVEGEELDFESDPDAVRTAVREIRRLAGADEAPAQVSIDLLLVADVFEQLGAIGDSVPDDDIDAAVQGVNRLLAVAADPAFVAASDRLETFASDECGLEPSTSAPAFDSGN